MAALKIHYDGWLKLPAGLLRALGAKAGDMLEASPREGGLVLRAVAGKKTSREPRLADPVPAESEAGDVPSTPKASRRAHAASPTQVAVALPPALRGAGRRRKAGASDEPAG